MALRRLKQGKGKDRDLLAGLQTSTSRIDELIADIAALDAALDTLVAKLNADSGVNDTDYAGAAAMTSDGNAADTFVA